MPYIGQAEVGQEWVNLVEAFTPNLTTGDIQIENTSTLAVEYIRASQAPTDALKHKGMTISGGERRTLKVEANVGIYVRALGSRPAILTVER